MSNDKAITLKQKVKEELLALQAEASLIAELAGLPDDDLLSFIAEVDESQYSLKEWSEAIIAFSEWENKNARTLGLVAKIEYLCCCVQGTTNEGRLLSLKAVWENFVDLYGVV